MAAFLQWFVLGGWIGVLAALYLAGYLAYLWLRDPPLHRRMRRSAHNDRE